MIKPSMINKLVQVARTSDINNKLAAGLLKKKHLLTPKSNINCTHSNGFKCSSLHAEANAILNYYGSELYFHNGRWRFLQKRYKKGEG